MDVKKQLGERVRFLRVGAGWTQQSLATRCGLDRAHIAHIEAGDMNPQLDTLEQLAEGLGVGLSELFMGVLTTNQQQRSP
jgi:transcriptional regulator with XRE-family HTH domain